MNNISELNNRIWNEYHEKRIRGIQPSIKMFTDIVKEQCPDIKYDEYCFLLEEYFRYMGGRFSSDMIVPQSFKWLAAIFHIKEFSF